MYNAKSSQSPPPVARNLSVGEAYKTEMAAGGCVAALLALSRRPAVRDNAQERAAGAIANLAARTGRTMLVISHNKPLAAQLYAEFKTFFPENAVEYFVSYYDYYQPEAYLPASDTYIEKDLQINDEIEKLIDKSRITFHYKFQEERYVKDQIKEIVIAIENKKHE